MYSLPKLSWQFFPLLFWIPGLSQAIMQSQTQTTRYDFLFLLYFSLFFCYGSLSFFWVYLLFVEGNCVISRAECVVHLNYASEWLWVVIMYSIIRDRMGPTVESSFFILDQIPEPCSSICLRLTKSALSSF